MFDDLQIYDRRERALVGIADLGLRILGPAARVARRRPASPPRRVLLLRLQRIGDLIMTLDAIDDVRQALPSAQIDLVVGSWNLELATRIVGLHRVETLDAAWLARDDRGLPLAAMLRRARGWAARHYDLAINFEPDIRGNLVIAATRAAVTAGFSSAGGGRAIDVALPYDPLAHTADNARRLVAAVLDVPPRSQPTRLELRSAERHRARDLLARARFPLIGIHVSGGRAIKQWPAERFADLAVRLARRYGGTFMLTGSSSDRGLVDPVGRALADFDVVDLVGDLDLPTLAAALEQADVLITGDTGPMHVAALVGTPVVAVFGPSDPRRYAPRDPRHTIVRIDLPCSPCNRIRLPPARCVGHTPDCLSGIDVEMVYRAVEQSLERNAQPRARTRSARG